MHIILQVGGEPTWGVECSHISDWIWDTGGFLTWRFSNSKHGGELQVVFSSKYVKALLHSQWSFSVHRAGVIRFPTHTVYSSVSDISSERAHYIETVKWVIITENIACGCSYQWHPPSMHSWMCPQRRTQRNSEIDIQENYIIILKSSICKPKSKSWFKVQICTNLVSTKG